jgi:hypothetical protein
VLAAHLLHDGVFQSATYVCQLAQQATEKIRLGDDNEKQFDCVSAGNVTTAVTRL